MSEKELREALEGLRTIVSRWEHKASYYNGKEVSGGTVPTASTVAIHCAKDVKDWLAALAAYPVGVEPPAIPARGRDNHGDRISNKGMCSGCGKPVIVEAGHDCWHSKGGKVWHETCSYRDLIEKYYAHNKELIEQLEALKAANGDSATRSPAQSGLPPNTPEGKEQECQCSRGDVAKAYCPVHGPVSW